ncbi:hypothetical protein [Geosporobacter ferrireducens]|uniref:Uncharacterized protein n=1 Tax=Geosporobacter ferrireducens TaxID=1424294 RepID=A0A1D8GIH7_9FIRM|nr:hypothetical protein [Geosporobacter ferrireducens]AOT70725.1 hypothetical protein Gferi_14755 [Geosporobacter ferrireducens]MTI57529.1 hypothetical protein [Geosporobacter ferrireducens]
MNKIKLMYDVVKTLKEKQVFKGTLKAEAKKDQVKVFSLIKDFEKNTVSGQVKSKISTMLDYEGKSIKHESSTEFNLQDCCDSKHHDFMRKMHGHHRHEGMKCCGVKSKLSKLAFILNVLNNMQVEELEDKGVLLSVHIDEVPEELKNVLQEKIQHKEEQHGSEQQCCCMKDFCFTEDINVFIKIQINKDSELEKAVVIVGGKQKNESGEQKDINIEAELNLIW